MDTEETALVDLSERQRQLQEEAAAVLADLDVLPLLRALGRPVQVGSVALGLMVARDIDLTVLCPQLDTPAVFAAATAVASHPRVRELVLRDDTGTWNVDLDYPDGLLWRLRYRSEAGDEWTLDIWFIHQDSRQFDLDHVESLPPRLTEETRRAILLVKDACLGRPWYSSYGIYVAVLDHGVRTPEGFRAYLEGGGTSRA